MKCFNGDLMSEDKITYSDVKEYESLFQLAPSFLIERFAKKNTNLVLKFESKIKGYINNLTAEQKSKLEIILNSDVDELQSVMREAYEKTGKKQFKILANPNYRQFIENNISELKRIINFLN